MRQIVRVPIGVAKRADEIDRTEVRGEAKILACSGSWESTCALSTIWSVLLPSVRLHPEGAAAGLSRVRHDTAHAQWAPQPVEERTRRAAGSGGGSRWSTSRRTRAPPRRRSPRPVARPGRARIVVPALDRQQVAARAPSSAAPWRPRCAIGGDVVDVLRHEIDAGFAEPARFSSSAPWPPGRSRSVPSSSRKGVPAPSSGEGVGRGLLGGEADVVADAEGGLVRAAHLEERVGEGVAVLRRDGEVEAGDPAARRARRLRPRRGAPRRRCARRRRSGGTGSAPSGAQRSPAPPRQGAPPGGPGPRRTSARGAQAPPRGQRIEPVQEREQPGRRLVPLPRQARRLGAGQVRGAERREVAEHPGRRPRGGDELRDPPLACGLGVERVPGRRSFPSARRCRRRGWRDDRAAWEPEARADRELALHLLRRDPGAAGAPDRRRRGTARLAPTRRGDARDTTTAAARSPRHVERRAAHVEEAVDAQDQADPLEGIPDHARSMRR